jgi:hypothetical protein
MSMNPKTAPCGSWQSPITSDLIVTQSIGLSEVRFDGQDVYWLEARPQKQGRNVLVRGRGAGSGTNDIVPKPFNVRTRVHEYGGGAWTVALGVLYFSNFADGRLYRLAPGESEPAPLTPAPLAHDRQWRFADGTRSAISKRIASDGRKLADLALHVHGPATLSHLSGALKDNGLRPPGRWGTQEARDFVAALGFPPEFSVSPSQKRPAELSVSGPMPLGDLHN